MSDNRIPADPQAPSVPAGNTADLVAFHLERAHRLRAQTIRSGAHRLAARIGRGLRRPARLSPRHAH